jgi:hypothetical protein
MSLQGIDFFALQTALHSVDTQNVSDDTTRNRLWKVQPITDTVRSDFFEAT